MQKYLLFTFSVLVAVSAHAQIEEAHSARANNVDPHQAAISILSSSEMAALIAEAPDTSKHDGSPAGAQSKFVAIVESAYATANKFEGANDRLEIYKNMLQDIRTLLHGRLRSWSGVLSKVGRDLRGQTYIEITIAPGWTIATYKDERADNAGSLIPDGSKLFGELSNIPIGAKVEFDAMLFRKEPVDGSYYGQPYFTARFADIRLIQ